MEPFLADLLKRHRDAARLTQEELAERSGVSARTISDIERGLRTSIYRDTASRLADALALSGAERTGFEASAQKRGEASRPEPSIPAPPTKLFGRTHEREIVRRALADASVRLVTLTGPGGIGKTRIAIDVATRARDTFDEVCFVALGALSEPSLVTVSIAHALGVVPPTGAPLDGVIRRIGGARVLLVLDTFEHVLDAGIDIASLIAACPSLAVLVTSREVLHLAGEHEIAISTLDLPSDDQDLETAPATALFLDRARAVAPELTLDDQSAQSIREICERVNGLPLAIELAAARVRHLSVASLRDHLDHRLDVLTGGPRDLPRRLRTMRDTVAWSYELLTADEQRLFRTLSIFSGGWTLGTARAIAGRSVLDVISALVDKSLVVVRPDERYDMLDVIREYGGERLAALGEETVAGRAHAGAMRALATEAEPELVGRAQTAWYRRLEAERDNIRSALRRSIATGDAETATAIAGAVWQFWRADGSFDEGRRWLRATLELGDAPGRHKVLWGAGWLAFQQDDRTEAKDRAAELLAWARAEGDTLAERNALTIEGMVLIAEDRGTEALVPLGRGLDICRARGRDWHLATSLLNLGMAVMSTGDPDGARELIDEGRRLYEEIGDDHFATRCLYYAALAAVSEGDPGRARPLLVESLGRFAKLGDKGGIAESLEGMSAVSAIENDNEMAAMLLGASREIRDTIAAPPFPYDLRTLGALVARARDGAGLPQWDEWERAGRVLPREDVISMVLDRSAAH